MLDVKSERNDCKDVPILKLVVLFHVIKQCLFVANEEVKLKMVVDSLIRRLHISCPEEILPKVL